VTRTCVWSFTALLTVGIGSAAAQPRPGMVGEGRSPVLMLANQKSVQEELKLGDEQVKAVAAITKALKQKGEDLTETDPKERMKKAAEFFKDAEKQVLAALKPEQAKRLRQIALQRQTMIAALEKPEVAKEMKLTEQQTKIVREFREVAMNEMAKVREGGADSREEARKKMTEISKATDEKLLKMLTDEQKAKWRDLLGEPFKGDLKPGFGLREPRER
jgi:hypothetical protein